jgi:hypothetical protein
MYNKEKMRFMASTFGRLKNRFLMEIPRLAARIEINGSDKAATATTVKIFTAVILPPNNKLLAK